MSLAKPGGAQKSKSFSTKNNLNKKKKRVYSENELDIPLLNSIIPAGIAKPKGQKKGKKFVDDPASMVWHCAPNPHILVICNPHGTFYKSYTYSVK